MSHTQMVSIVDDDPHGSGRHQGAGRVPWDISAGFCLGSGFSSIRSDYENRLSHYRSPDAGTKRSRTAGKTAGAGLTCPHSRHRLSKREAPQPRHERRRHWLLEQAFEEQSLIECHGTKHRPWVTALLTRRPTKVAAIALANKLARMAWAMMASGERYNYPAALRVCNQGRP